MIGPLMDRMQPEQRIARNHRRSPSTGRYVAGIAWLMMLGVLGGASSAAESVLASPQRLISLNPSLTAIVLRLGEGERLVGVDEYSADLLPEVAGLPRVGGLFDPNLESILALRPDRVLLVAGIDQQSHGARLEGLGIEVETFENARLRQVLENIERMGKMLGRNEEAAERIGAILEMHRAVAKAVRGLEGPATLAVVDRSPLYLVGGKTFLDEMLEAVGARNLARTLGDGYPRGSIEWVIGARPELLLDMTPGAADALEFWSRWPSLPAVARHRVLTLDASRISMPGPELDRALRELAIAVHGAEIDRAISMALEDPGVVAATEPSSSEPAR